MFNYGNLSDVEFEELCMDIMKSRLHTNLHIYTRGRDGGIDICDTPVNPEVMIQAKHYFFSIFSDLKRSLIKETEKVKNKKPKQYYVCTSARLTPGNVTTIYEMFHDYMDSTDCVLGRNDLDAILSEKEGVHYLRKYPKLGITVEMLRDINYGDASVDQEVLLNNMKEDSKFFVATGLYYKALDALKKNRVLILTGNPGCGKTMTSRMLLFYMLKEYEYSFVYVSDHNIKESKALISSDSSKKEIVFLDDCFGQRYFEMRGETGQELMSLIQYIRMNKNKSLLMNSRVTIYREAQKKFQQLGEAVLNDELDEICIDMSKITDVEKAQIFYNHIYFAKVSTIIMKQIRANYNYRKIVSHRNYNPRIIKYITMKKFINNVETGEYVDKVLSLLDNPKDIWEDEYRNKLEREDRIFMSTLFSLTDAEVLSEIHKRAFYHRLDLEGVDVSADPWTSSRNRLIGSMIRIIEKNRSEFLSVADPSVNDFMDVFLKNDSGEKERILSSATEYKQYMRLDPSPVKRMIKDTSILGLNFENDTIKRKCILPVIVSEKITDDAYVDLIKEFYLNPYGYISGVSSLWILDVYLSLLKKCFDDKYGTRASVTEDSITKLLNTYSFYETPQFFEEVKKKGQDWLLKKYEKSIYDAIDGLLIEYLESANMEDYYDENPIEVLSRNTTNDQIGPITDYETAAQEVLDVAVSNMESEVDDIVYDFPEPFSSWFDTGNYIENFLDFS